QKPGDFFSLLKRFKVTRMQALRLADPCFAYPLPVMSLRRMFLTAAGAARPVVIAIGNVAHIQIYESPVTDVQAAGLTLDVRGADFRLWLREDRVYDAWAVRRPGIGAIGTTVEIFDEAGNTTVVVFGTNDVMR
ncbi:MAG: hemin-degrading factor, partial [Stutzerimonas stutzeri]